MNEFRIGDRVRMANDPNGEWGTVRDPREYYVSPEWEDYAEDIVENGWVSVEWDDGNPSDGFMPEDLVKVK